VNIFRRASNIYTFISVSFFGIGGIVLGFNGLINRCGIDNLYQTKGEIVSSGNKVIYVRDFKKFKNVYVIQVFDNRNDTITCYTYVEKDREKLDLIKFEKGAFITVWTDPESMRIEQVRYNNEIALKYEPPYWVYVFFLILGIAVTFVCIGALINQPKEIFKGKKIELQNSKKNKLNEIQVLKKELKPSTMETDEPFKGYSNCPACGFKLNANARACPDCGLNLC
jgi:hypothetical protein